MARGDRRRGLPARIVAAAVGVALVLANALVVLPASLTLVGTAASLGPAVPIPVGQIAVALVVGGLVAVLCIVIAAVIRRPAAASWTLAIAAGVASLIACVWPIVATAAAAVDRAADVVPFIVELVERVL